MNHLNSIIFLSLNIKSSLLFKIFNLVTMIISVFTKTNVFIYFYPQ